MHQSQPPKAPERSGAIAVELPICRRSATRRQHQPPCQAPCTSTKVFGAPVCAGAGALPKVAALAPAPALASTPRRHIAIPMTISADCFLLIIRRGAACADQRREVTLDEALAAFMGRGAGLGCPPGREAWGARDHSASTPMTAISKQRSTIFSTCRPPAAGAFWVRVPSPR